MQAGQPSRTAEYMALFRALEGRLPRKRRLFVDPIARRFLSARLRAVVDLARIPGVAGLECRLIDQRWPGVRTAAVARTRFIDDLALQAVAGGARQVAILGAGFDARAFRLPALRECAIFEVDHPATQARKRRALGARRADPVRFVATDFAEGGLDAALASHGFQLRQRSLLIWEGVTNYLSERAVDQTLRWCARTATGSELVFTYIDAAVLRHPEAFFGTARVRQKLAEAGEEWTFGLDPRELAGHLRERGLDLVADLGAAEVRSICYGPAAARMRGYEFYRIARARVA